MRHALKGDHLLRSFQFDGYLWHAKNNTTFFVLSEGAGAG